MSQKILIVEDDLVFCKMLTSFLSKNDFVTADAQTASTACDMLEKDNYDLVILDYRLPDNTGLDVLKWKGEKEISGKTIMLTRVDDDELEKKARELGAVDFVRKPISPKELLIKIRDILNS